MWARVKVEPHDCILVFVKDIGNWTLVYRVHANVCEVTTICRLYQVIFGLRRAARLKIPP